MPDVMYLRKSRADLDAEAHGETEILARHEAELMRTAKRLGLTVTAIYREIVSGETIAARPVMQRLLAEVEGGAWDSVLVMELERLARGDSIDQGIVARTFTYSGTKIVTPNKVYDLENEFDEEYVEFGLFMSRREYKTINRRQQRGRVASVREGKYVGNKTPYGYTREKLQGQKGWTLVPDPETAQVVQNIYSWYTGAGGEAPIGTSLIARRLNESGVQSATGHDWTTATIRDKLANPVYAGWVRWGARKAVKLMENGEVKSSRPRSSDCLLIKGLHEPLISQELFDAAQTKLALNPGRPGPKQVTMKNPLSGLIFCGKCGRAMIRRPYSNGYPDSLMCSYTSCDTVSSRLSDVEAALLDALRSWYESLTLGKKPETPFDDRPMKSAIASLEKELEAVGKQETRAYELVELGVYTTEVFLSRSKELAAKRAELTAKLETQRQELKDRYRLVVAQFSLGPQISRVLESYPKASTPQEKNDLLRSVLKSVTYNKSTRTRWGAASDMTLTLNPLLPDSYR